MNDLFLLSKKQLNRIKPYFPLSHGVPRVDDLRVISGIIYVIKNGLRWKDAPQEYGPYKTLYNRFVRWSRREIFPRIFTELAGKAGTPDRLMIDATHLKAHRTAASLRKNGMFPRCLGRTKGGLNSKLHAVCEGQGRPVALLLSEGQMSDYKGAALLLPSLPKAKELLADRGYDADWFRAALIEKGITPCIPTKRTARHQENTTKPFISNGTRWSRCSEKSRIGGGSLYAMTVALTPSSRLSVSRQPSSFI
jgi:transposase